jgi:hypothetical protein
VDVRTPVLDDRNHSNGAKTLNRVLEKLGIIRGQSEVRFMRGKPLTCVTQLVEISLAGKTLRIALVRNHSLC